MKVVTCSLTLVGLILTGCGAGSGIRDVSRSREVEIAPNEWLEVRMVDTVYEPDSKKGVSTHWPEQTGRIIDMEETQLSFEWNGKLVVWKGREIPVSLRKWDDRLFMIGFNREELYYQKTRFVFFKMTQDGTGFETIPASDYPREIATQNMWMSPETRYFGTRSGKMDSWELIRKLQVENRYFRTTLTAQIWYQIETGTEHSDMPSIPHEFVVQYAEKYNPVPLPTIVK